MCCLFCPIRTSWNPTLPMSSGCFAFWANTDQVKDAEHQPQNWSCVLFFFWQILSVAVFFCCFLLFFSSHRLQPWQHVGGPEFSGVHLQLHARRSGLHEGSAPLRDSPGSLSLGEVPPHPPPRLLSAVSFSQLGISSSSSPSRLAEAKSSVVKALADDFDTPRAVSAVMNLVHHANRQLQPVSKVTGAKAWRISCVGESETSPFSFSRDLNI